MTSCSNIRTHEIRQQELRSRLHRTYAFDNFALWQWHAYYCLGWQQDYINICFQRRVVWVVQVGSKVTSISRYPVVWLVEFVWVAQRSNHISRLLGKSAPPEGSRPQCWSASWADRPLHACIYIYIYIYMLYVYTHVLYMCIHVVCIYTCYIYIYICTQTYLLLLLLCMHSSCVRGRTCLASQLSPHMQDLGTNREYGHVAVYHATHIALNQVIHIAVILQTKL